MAPPRLRWILVTAALCMVACLAAATPANAGTRSVKAAALKHGKIVFKVRGVRASKIGAARLRVGRSQRRLAVRRVRRGTLRGIVKVQAPRSLRRRLSRVRSPRRRAQVLRKQTKLVLTTVHPTRKSNPPSNIAADVGNCALAQNAVYVSPTGSDANPGTAAQPWQTLEKAESNAAPGTNVVLRGGTYSALGKVTYLNRSGTSSAPISVSSYPGESPVIRGHVIVEGNYRNLCGLRLNGPTGQVWSRTADRPDGEEVKLYIGGDHVRLTNSEISGAAWHAGVYLRDANDASLVGNYVHDNGRFGDPSHANLDQGIYWDSGSRGLIEGNRIEHNVAYGIQLYPEVNGVTVRGNTMTRHGRAAVIIAENASNNVVTGNSISGNRKGVQTWELRGRGNVVSKNRLWDNPEGNLGDVEGLELMANQLN